MIDEDNQALAERGGGITAARRDAQRALERLERAEAREKTRVAMVVAYTSGETTSVQKLAEQFGVSPETARNTLKRAQVYKSQRRGKVTPELRERIVAALKDNPNVAEQAVYWGLSAASIRAIGQSAGLIKKGPPRIPRPDAQMRDIEAIDAKLRDEFGGGLTALGTALSQWHKKNAPSIRQAIDIKMSGASSTPDGAPWE